MYIDESNVSVDYNLKLFVTLLLAIYLVYDLLLKTCDLYRAAVD